MSFHQALRDRKTEAGATVSLRRPGLVELLKHRRQLIRSDTHSGVFDRHIRERLVAFRGDRDLASARRKLQRVAGEIVKNLSKALAVCKDSEFLRDLDDDLN